MSKSGPTHSKVGLAAALAVLLTAGVSAAAPAVSSTPSFVEPAPVERVLVAQADTEYRELQPRYEPAPPEPENSYNDEYIFGLTRGVADSTLHPAGKVLIFPITVPLDLVLLPFAALGGFF